MRADFDMLARIGGLDNGGVNRLALSPEDIEARSWFANRMEDGGLCIFDDDAGNLSGRLASRHPGARTLLVGSHLDSVPNGGRFDGALGMIAALECARTIQEAGIDLPVHLEVIDFTDDEGCWRSLFGVRALVGLLNEEDIQDSTADNAPFRAALRRAGIEPRTVFNATRDPQTIAGYLELHIEQGSRLERLQKDIGVVTGIVGRTTYKLTFHGQAGHSGTTDMYRRRDALRGAALFITRAHDAIRARYGDGVFNCGNIDVEPGAFNVIPSLARLTVECRHVQPGLLAEMETEILRLARECAAAHALTVEIEKTAHMPAANMDEGVMQAIEAACERRGCSSMRLASFSGHAPQITSTIAPSGMIFIPSVDGISHHPNEYSHWEDVERGTQVLLDTLLMMALNA